MRSAADLLHEARAQERSASNAAAVELYEAAIAVAESAPEPAVLAEGLRRLAVIRHRQGESGAARELCRRSYEVARATGNDLLAAEALNALGGIELETGTPADARRHFLRAVELGGRSRELCARVEQNLGILANIQGDLDEAHTRYAQSLDAYRAANDEHGCAIAYHNLGMASASRQQFDAAERYFQQSSEIAERARDAYLKGLCLVNHAKVHVVRGRYTRARQDAESALAIFEQVGVGSAMADAYRVLGMVYRETGRAALAEARLRTAIELAVSAGATLNEAEASRELALLYQAMGRNQEALSFLNVAHGRFAQVDARVDLVHVDGKLAELQATYFTLVREWGQSIESSDAYTYGHCERVASYALGIARGLQLNETEQTTIQLGAYLHDLGKVRVPHEILNKPGPLTAGEVAIVRMHPIWGIELLHGIDFPWDLKPIIRWHHERYDGTGYPDRLRGHAIPLAAQIVGIADVYDALTTARPYRPAFLQAAARAAIADCRSWWSDAVYDGFLASLAGFATTQEASFSRLSLGAAACSSHSSSGP